MSESKQQHVYLLLTAVHHNWSLMKAGDWNHTEWFVYSNGSYLCRTYYNPTWEALESLETEAASGQARGESVPWRVHTANGKMRAPSFRALLDAMETDPWRPDGEVIHACDGDAWELRQFDMSGKTIRDSGRLGYIYGNAVLERITALLP